MNEISLSRLREPSGNKKKTTQSANMDHQLETRANKEK